MVPPTVIYQLPSALYRSSLELSPLDHSHMFAMYTPPLTRVCGALLQEATAVPGLHCSLCPTICLSEQWDSCVLFLGWYLPWGPSEPYRGDQRLSHWHLCLVSPCQESRPLAHSPMSSRTTWARMVP